MNIYEQWAAILHKSIYTFFSSQILTRYWQEKVELFFKYFSFVLNIIVPSNHMLLENNTNLGTKNKQNLLVFVQKHKNIIIYF